MNAPFSRLLVDISYTRTQRGSIGVTRVVWSLLKEFQQITLQKELQCHAVAIHGRDFREISSSPIAASADASNNSVASPAARMLRWITSGRVRELALGSLPLSLLYGFWRLYSRWIFNALSKQALPVVFQKGDVLFMGDASWHYEAWHAAQRARVQGAQVVLLVHDLIPLRHPEYVAPLISMVFKEWLTRMLDCSDAVVCNSEATENDLKSYAASLGITLPPVGHFRLGCDPVHSANEQTVRPALAGFFHKPGASFVAVGSFELRKNYAWLLQVFEHLWANGQDIRLLIAGRPTAEGRALIEKMKLHPEQGRKLLTVFDAADDELQHIYGQAWALLFPSLAEGFGLPLVEARTRGCLVIASDLPVFRELADEGVSLYPRYSAEGIEALLMACAKADRRALVAPMPAFNWRASAAQCLQVTTELLSDQFPEKKLAPASLSGL